MIAGTRISRPLAVLVVTLTTLAAAEGAAGGAPQTGTTDMHSPTPSSAPTDEAAEEGFVNTSDGVRLFFRRYGDLDGPTPLVVPNAIYLEAFFRRLAADRPVVFYDLRNRGYSDAVGDPAAIGIDHDVADLEAVREHLGLERIDLIGHSYLGIVVALYAMEHPERVDRVVQIGPPPPARAVAYGGRGPADYPDVVDPEAYAALVADLRDGASQRDPEAFYQRFWGLMLPPMFGDPEAATFDVLPPTTVANEHVHSMLSTVARVFASMGDYDHRDRAARLETPVLTVHGTLDRNAPFEGGRDWVRHLANARLLSVEGAAHVPYAEQPALVLPAIRTFLAGEWPGGARDVDAHDARRATGAPR